MEFVEAKTKLQLVGQCNIPREWKKVYFASENIVHVYLLIARIAKEY